LEHPAAHPIGVMMTGTFASCSTCVEVLAGLASVSCAGPEVNPISKEASIVFGQMTDDKRSRRTAGP
jgi:hypothetical protein